MYKRNVPLIIIISILILMLALVSWQLLKINNTLTSLQQQIAKAALVSSSTASSAETSQSSSKLLSTYTVTTSQKIKANGGHDVTVSVIPSEYSKSTRVSIKINNKSFDLKQINENTFERTCDTDSFAQQDITVFITDGTSTKSEVLIGVVDPIYGPLDSEKSEARVTMENKGDQNIYAGDINLAASLKSGVSSIKNMEFVVRQGRHDLYTKNIKTTGTTVSIDKRVDIKTRNTKVNRKVEMLIRVYGEDGYTYEYAVTASGDTSTGNYDYNTTPVLDTVIDAKGNVIWNSSDTELP